LSCSTAALVLASQLLLKEDRATQCCAPPTVTGYKLIDPTHPHSWMLASCPVPTLGVWLLTHTSYPTLSGQFLVLPFSLQAVVNYVLFLWCSVLFRGIVQSAHQLCWIMFPGGQVVCGAWGCRFIPLELGPCQQGITGLCLCEIGLVCHRVQFSLIHIPLIFLKIFLKEVKTASDFFRGSLSSNGAGAELDLP
jgi:hypothetical protein